MLLIVAAALATTALAERPDDRAGVRGPGGIAEHSWSVSPDDRAGARGPGAYESEQQSAAVRPDDEVGARGPGAIGSSQFSSATRPDDRVGVRGPGAVTPLAAQSASTGFDWDDALIGSLGGIGIALIVMGLLFLVTSRRSRVRMA